MQEACLAALQALLESATSELCQCATQTFILGEYGRFQLQPSVQGKNPGSRDACTMFVPAASCMHTVYTVSYTYKSSPHTVASCLCSSP